MGTLAFMHVPKTGGTSLDNLLRTVYGSAYHRVSNGSNLVQRLDGISKTNKDIACISGHFEWGMHRYLHKNVRYVVVLRHPIERLLSLFAFVQTREMHKLHQSSLSMDFARWVDQSEYACFDNDITRFMSGMSDRGIFPRKTQVTSSDFQRAVTNLFKCWSVGDTAHLTRFVQDIADTENWETVPEIPHLLMQPDRLRRSDLPSAVYRQLEKRNTYDMALWSMYQQLRPFRPREEITS